VRLTQAIDAGVGRWQAARTSTSGRQVCGVIHACGVSNVF
jgi:hypothetical protein